MVILGAFHYPESPILLEKEEVKAIVDGVDLGTGTVYVGERLVCWQSTQGRGFTIDYPNISLHAITTDPNVYHSKCLYVMIDGRLSLQGQASPNVGVTNGSSDHAASDCESESEVEQSQLIFVPNDADSINAIFSALSQGQALNPDMQDCLDEEEEEDDNIYDDAEDFCEEISARPLMGDGDVGSLSTQMQNNSIQYSHDSENADMDDNQFEDAD